MLQACIKQAQAACSSSGHPVTKKELQPLNPRLTEAWNLQGKMAHVCPKTLAALHCISQTVSCNSPAQNTVGKIQRNMTWDAGHVHSQHRRNFLLIHHFTLKHPAHGSPQPTRNWVMTSLWLANHSLGTGVLVGCTADLVLIQTYWGWAIYLLNGIERGLVCPSKKWTTCMWLRKASIRVLSPSECESSDNGIKMQGTGLLSTKCCYSNWNILSPWLNL